MEELNVLSLSDIARRWGVSRQRVQYLYSTDANFPKPFTTVKKGLQPLFKESDVKIYEPTKGMPKQ